MELRTTDEGIYTNEWYTSNSDYYNSAYNMFTNNGNCLHYAISRIQEISQEKFPTFSGNAIEVSRLPFLKKQKTPSFGTLVVFGGTYTGHIAVVEQVNPDGSILISQSSWQGYIFDTMILYPENNYSCNGMYLVGFYMFNGVIKAKAKEKIKQKTREISESIKHDILGTSIESTTPLLLPVDGLFLTGTIGLQCFKNIGQNLFKRLIQYFESKYYYSLTY